MEYGAIFLFVFILFLCVLLSKPIIFALVAGYIIFAGYALIKKYSVKDVLYMSLNSLKTIKNIIILFIMIGMLTALWRSSGTIASVVYYASKYINPSVIIIMVFLLNCLVSVLTGTAFGTAATMGVISMAMASSMGVNRAIIGGAILSGVFFGDRCSPVSTSALLITELTGTDIFKNIKLMVRTSIVPFIVTCLIYLIVGLKLDIGNRVLVDTYSIFSIDFKLSYITLIPAAVIILLSAFKVNVKVTIFISIILAFIISFLFQKKEIFELFNYMILGYHSENVELGKMINGGGVVSMLNVISIVCLSSTYSGIFEGTGLLNKLKEKVEIIAEKISSYISIFFTSIITSMISCNQTLSIMLTYQLCKDIKISKEQLAIDLENTVVLIAPIIPWSIASAVPLSTASAPTESILFAFYIYLVPIWRFIIQGIIKRNPNVKRES